MPGKETPGDPPAATPLLLKKRPYRSSTVEADLARLPLLGLRLVCDVLPPLPGEEMDDAGRLPKDSIIS